MPGKLTEYALEVDRWYQRRLDFLKVAGLKLAIPVISRAVTILFIS